MKNQMRNVDSSPNNSLRHKIQLYTRQVAEMECYLKRSPNEWGRYQSEFNQEINGIFRDLMVFEKENIASKNYKKNEKLKDLFIRRFRSLFVVGDYLNWSLKKPYGYAGDYKIIDDIYLNSPKTSGFERLYDNYFQMSSISIAVRNRKEDFKKIILKYVAEHSTDKAKILSLASGPCRDVAELLNSPIIINNGAIFHCFDIDENALAYGKELIQKPERVNFYKHNAVKLALSQDVKNKIPEEYDIVFSTGLFDYLNDKISIRLITNLRKLLKKGGILAISDVRDKFSNPSIYFMEWVADWHLLYRSDEDFRDIFLKAGFDSNALSFGYEQQGLLQYVIARNE